jgi:hypothetical protein
VPPEDRRKLLYENALRVYRIDATVAQEKNQGSGFHAS